MDNRNKLKESKNKDIENQLTQELNEYYESALETYKTKVESITRILEQDELIKLLYDHKLEAIMNFNKVFNNHQETLSNTTNLNSYNKSKKLLEIEIEKFESRQLESNMHKSDQLCQKLLSESYAPVN
jgi:hypothetical protein